MSHLSFEPNFKSYKSNLLVIQVNFGVQLAVYGRVAGGEWDPGDSRIALSLIVPQAPGSESLRMVDFETPAYLTKERGSFAELAPPFIPLLGRGVPSGVPIKVPRKASLLSRLSSSLTWSSSSRSSSYKG